MNDSCRYPCLRLPPERGPLSELVLSRSPSPSTTSHGGRNRNSGLVSGRAASLASCGIRSGGGDLGNHTTPRLYPGSVASDDSTWSLPGVRQGQIFLLQSSSTRSPPGALYPRLTRRHYRPRPSFSSRRNSRSISRRKRNTFSQFSLWNLYSPRTVQTTARPIMPKISSDFTLQNKGPKQRTLDAITHRVVSLLKKGPGPARSGRLETAEYGNVYILTRQETKGFVKIGKTSGEVSSRMARISQRGYYGQFVSHQDERDRPFRHFGFAEKLIHEELHNIRYESQFKATPQTDRVPVSPRREEGRTEWFKMDPQEAMVVMVRWRDWLHLCEPYDQRGNLRGYWKHVISSAEKYKRAKHGDIGSHWAVLLKPPSRYQLGWYYLVCSLKIFLESLLYTLRILCTLFQRLYHICYG